MCFAHIILFFFFLCTFYIGSIVWLDRNRAESSWGKAIQQIFTDTRTLDYVDCICSLQNKQCVLSHAYFFSSSFFYMYWRHLAAKITEYTVIDIIINFLITGPCFYLAVLYCFFSFTSYSGMKNFRRVTSLYTWTLNQSFSSCREKFLLLAHLFLKTTISIRWYFSLPAPASLHLILHLG